jgi:cystathionine gamma-lyase
MLNKHIQYSKDLVEYQQKYDEKFEKMGFSTKCIHIGQEPDMINGAVNPSINLSTTYAQVSPGIPYGQFDYSRCGNPTRLNLERLIGGLEGGKHSLIWSSAMGATTGIIQLLKTGDEVICIDDVYGGTQRYFRKISNPQQGIKYNFISFDTMEPLQKSLNQNTKIVWVESPTNPTLKTTDIEEVVKLVKDYNPEIMVVVDNTFMSPYNCKPLELGVDLVMESATKYIGGHSDVIMGITSTNNKELHDKLYFIHKSIGAVPSPFDCYLAIRGIKTLSLRVQRQNQNALAIANFLEQNEKVEKVLYPGLESSPYHRIAKKQQKGFGGVIAFIIKGGIEESKKFLSELKIFTLAESLGSVESLAEHPALMTHFSVPPEIRKELGIEDSFIRLSVGVEDIEDLVGDLDFALKSI